MLTGDKIETAINIAYACKLINSDMERIVINCHEYKELRKLLLDEYNNIEKNI